MAQRNKLSTKAMHSAPIGKRMAQGAGVAFILIVFFLLGAGEPDPDWPKFWVIKPLIIVPLAGAIGGILFYFLDYFRHQGGWTRILANLLGLIGYIIVLWLGTVLGLEGTWWD